MDKNTLSHYGWVVIVIIIIAILITAATPFASFIKDGIRENTQDFGTTAGGMFDDVLGGGTGNGSNVPGSDNSPGDEGPGNEAGDDSSNEDNEDDLVLASPILALDGNTLIITKGSNKTEGYEIFIDDVSQGTIGAVHPTEYDLSGFAEDSFEITVIAKAVGMADSEPASITYSRSKLSAPVLTIEDGMLVITATSTETEDYEFFLNESNEGTIAASERVECDLSNLTEASYEITIIAKADGMLDSDPVSITYNHNKLIAPTLSINDDMLTIVTSSTKTEKYEIFIDSTSQGTIVASNVTEYDLSDLTEGNYKIVVVAKADGMENSDDASITYTSNKLIAPTLSISTNNLRISTTSTNTEMYEIFINGASRGIIAASSITKYNLSDLTEGNYEIVVIAKADGMKNSDAVSIMYVSDKLIAPTVSVVDDKLVITTESTKTENYYITYKSYDYDTDIEATSYGTVAADTTIEEDISYLTYDYNEIIVVAKADGMRNSDSVLATYSNSKVGIPYAWLNYDERMVRIPITTTNAEIYEIFVDGTSKATFSASEAVNYDLSYLPLEAVYEIIIIGKADGLEDSVPCLLTYSNNKLIAPTLSINSNKLIISTTSTHTEMYEIFVDGESQGLYLTSGSRQYEYSLSKFKEGSYDIDVMARSYSMANSDSVSIKYDSLDLIAPTLSISGTKFTINTTSSATEAYKIFIDGSHVRTFSIGNPSTPVNYDLTYISKFSSRKSCTVSVVAVAEGYNDSEEVFTEYKPSSSGSLHPVIVGGVGGGLW